MSTTPTPTLEDAMTPTLTDTAAAERFPNLAAAVRRSPERIAQAEVRSFSTPAGWTWAGYTEGELRLAYAAIVTLDDSAHPGCTAWKLPVDVTLNRCRGYEQAVVEAAIDFYLGGEAFCVELPDRTVRVTAPGYYELIGA